MTSGADTAGMVAGEDDGIVVRLLRPDEGAIVGEAIRLAYGDSYDAAWVYDPDEVGRRIADGLFVSCVAEAPDGSLLCHAGLSRTSIDDQVGESGQAVTLPAARGHHLFQRVKLALAAWATAEGLAGMFSEVTTAHPYSERANVDLGAHETGFLLGWIPATVSNDAASGRSGDRTSVALFYLKTNDGHDRPVYAPDRHRDVVAEVIANCGLRGAIAVAPPGTSPGGRTRLHTQRRDDHNIAILTIEAAGDDVVEAVQHARQHLFDEGVDVVYVDLPLEDPCTEEVGNRLDDVGVTFAGVFPNGRVAGDVLRLQALNGLAVEPGSVTTASPHGEALLTYVLEDLARHG